MTRIPIYILAGGKSRRFGSDKALAVLDGRPLIQRIAEAIRPHAAQITVVAERADKYAQLGLRTIADLQPDLGPLGGLFTAMRDCPDEEWLLLLSCDLLQIKPDWIDVLLEERTDTAHAVAFKPDLWQPLLALYCKSAYSQIASQISTPHRSLQALLNAIRVVEAPLPADWPKRLQANTLSELADA